MIEARGAAEAKDDDGKPVPYVQLFLDFADDGRMIERRLREMPSHKPLGRETYAADGTVRVFGPDGKELVVRKTTLTAARAPDLNPDAKDLVVLPLPLRTIDHVRKALKLENRAYGDLHFDEGLALLAACYGEGNGDEAAKLFQQCFRNRDQHGVGFFVLLAACGQNLDGEHVDVLTDLPNDSLAQYLALYSSPVLRKHASQWAVGGGQWGQGFLQRLALSHALYQRWQNGKAVGGTEAQRQAERDRALDHVRRNQGTALGFALLGLLEDRARDDETAHKGASPAYRDLADAWLLFVDAPGLEYAARYENARCLCKGGDRAEARQRWRALYEKTLDGDELPAIDGDFRLALLGEGDEADEWSDLLRKTAERLVEHKRRPAALALAAQCWQLGDGPAADRTLDAALDGVEEEKERITLQEAAVAFYESRPASGGRRPAAGAADRARPSGAGGVVAARRPAWRSGATCRRGNSNASKRCWTLSTATRRRSSICRRCGATTANCWTSINGWPRRWPCWGRRRRRTSRPASSAPPTAGAPSTTAPPRPARRPPGYCRSAATAIWPGTTSPRRSVCGPTRPSRGPAWRRR